MTSLTANPIFSDDAMRDGVETLLRSAQRARSIALESGASEGALEMMQPWLFGPKSLMPLLADLAMGKREITVSGYMNLLTIAYRLEPTIAVGAVFVGNLPELEDAMAVYGEALASTDA